MLTQNHTSLAGFDFGTTYLLQMQPPPVYLHVIFFEESGGARGSYCKIIKTKIELQAYRAEKKLKRRGQAPSLPLNRLISYPPHSRTQWTTKERKKIRTQWTTKERKKIQKITSWSLSMIQEGW
jgi:hypothetical protein